MLTNLGLMRGWGARPAVSPEELGASNPLLMGQERRQGWLWFPLKLTQQKETSGSEFLICWPDSNW